MSPKTNPSEIVADLNKLAGEIDHNAALPRPSNPYSPGTPAYTQWQAGWDAAESKTRDSSVGQKKRTDSM
jgi:hypothetical protein